MNKKLIPAWAIMLTLSTLLTVLNGAGNELTQKIIVRFAQVNEGE